MSRVQISGLTWISFFLFFFFFFLIFLFIFFFYVFLSLLLQCKFANSTLLSILSFSNFITPYDAQASSAFSALIYFTFCTLGKHAILFPPGNEKLLLLQIISQNVTMLFDSYAYIYILGLFTEKPYSIVGAD